MRQFIYFLVWAVLVSAGCNKEEEKQKYNVIKDQGTLLGSGTRDGESQYLRLLEKDPKNLSVLVKLGNYYFDSGQHRKSIEMYQRALKINPNDANVRTDMGVMYRKLGEFDNAIRAFRRAADSNPRHVQSRYNLGVVYYHDKKNMVKAADVWEEVLSIDPRHPQAAGLKQFINDVRKGPKSSGVPSAGQKNDGWIK